MENDLIIYALEDEDRRILSRFYSSLDEARQGAVNIFETRWFNRIQALYVWPINVTLLKHEGFLDIMYNPYYKQP